MTICMHHPVAAPPRLYGRRKGRPLRARKTRLMEELLPRLRFDAPEAGATPWLVDPAALFPFRPRGIRLEVGFGGGEHLAAEARRNPETGFIGCEPFINGVASLLDHIEREALGNIRIFPDDARLLLDALPETAIEACFVLFPDPWPKARHAERRFISEATCTQLARVMPRGADLHLASDDPGMIVWIRDVMNITSSFRCAYDALRPPEGWTPTRYEQKALKAGRAPAYMIYRRV